jgi:hypothetical protein
MASPSRRSARCFPSPTAHGWIRICCRNREDGAARIRRQGPDLVASESEVLDAFGNSTASRACWRSGSRSHWRFQC